MSNIPMFILLFQLITLFIKSCNSFYAGLSRDRITAKFRKMDLELVLDMERKIKSIQFIQRSYYKTTTFQIGNQMYDIRSKYRQMVILYSKAILLTPDKNNVVLDTLDIKNMDRTDLMIEVQTMSMDIDKMIIMLTELEKINGPRSKLKDHMRDYYRRGNMAKAQREQKQKRAEKKALREKMKKITNHQIRRFRNKPETHFEDGFQSDYETL